MTLFSLAHLTVVDMPPPEMIRFAAAAGYDAVGLRLLRVTDTTPGYPLMEDPAMLAATRAALAETGIAVQDIEFVKITPGIDLDALEGVLDAGAAIGAKQLITAPYDPDLSRLSDRLGELAERAAARGIGTVLEFFPWTVVPDLATAKAVTAAAGPAVGVLVDTLHFDRSGSRLADLAATDPARLPFLHLCDAAVHPPYDEAALLHTAREARLPPGEGQIDLAAILAVMPKGVPIGLEVPMAPAPGQDPRAAQRAAATRALAGARALVAALAA